MLGGRAAGPLRAVGTIVTEGKKLLALEDTCKAYAKPCVLDAKVRNLRRVALAHLACERCRKPFARACGQQCLTAIYAATAGRLQHRLRLG